MLDKIKQYLNPILIGLSSILGLLFWFEKRRKEEANTLLQNYEDKQEIQKIDESVNKDQSQLDTEEEKRKLLEEQTKKEVKDVDNSTLIDFFSRRK